MIGITPSFFTRFTTTRELYDNVIFNAYLYLAPVVSALCLTARERAQSFRRNEGDSQKSGADRHASKDDRGKRQCHDGSRSQSLAWNRLRAGKTYNAAICRRG